MARDDVPRWVGALPPRWRNEIDAEVARAITGEFLGSFIFLLLTTTSSGSAFATGISYAVASFAVVTLSGGHVIPVISLAYALSGHQHAVLSGLYAVAQILGGIAAALVEVVLLPGVRLAHHHSAAAWLPATPHHTGWFSTLIWEFLLTTIVVLVAYGTTVGNSRYNVVAPLAIGLAIYAATEAGGAYTGGIINPVRLIAPAIVFLAGWTRFWFYILGQLLAIVAGAAFAVSAFGAGPAYSENRAELYDRAGGRLTEALMPTSRAEAEV